MGGEVSINQEGGGSEGWVRGDKERGIPLVEVSEPKKYQPWIRLCLIVVPGAF